MQKFTQSVLFLCSNHEMWVAAMSEHIMLSYPSEIFVMNSLNKNNENKKVHVHSVKLFWQKQPN